MWLLSLEGLKLPGSAAARSRPTDGFSAMTRVLLTQPSLATSARPARDGEPGRTETGHRPSRRIAPCCARRRARWDGDRPPAEPPDRAFSMSAGTGANRAARLAQRVGHDRVRHPEADAVAAADRRREDRRDHAPAPVHDRP